MINIGYEYKLLFSKIPFLFRNCAGLIFFFVKILGGLNVEGEADSWDFGVGMQHLDC